MSNIINHTKKLLDLLNWEINIWKLKQFLAYVWSDSVRLMGKVHLQKINLIFYEGHVLFQEHKSMLLYQVMELIEELHVFL